MDNSRIQKKGDSTENLIFLHGAGPTYETYQGLIDELAKEFTIYYFNLPGHGSEKFVDSFEELNGIVKEKITSLDLDEFILVGHSFGGLCALKIGSEIERCKKMILLDPIITPLQKNKISLLYNYLISKQVVGLYYHPNINSLRFISRGSLDLIRNVIRSGTEIDRAMKVLFEAIYTGAPYELLSEGKREIVLIYGEGDKTVEYERLPKEALEEAIFVKGGHDWCLSDPELAGEIIRDKVLR